MRKTLVFIGLAILLLLTACGKELEANLSRDLPDIEFTNHDGETLTREDLKGKWWIADLIFTNCETVCIPMTNNMKMLQDEAAKKDLDINFLSFSVDPENDTPEVLKEYAEDYEVNLDNWTFLTGYDFETVEEFAEESFVTIVRQPEDSDQVDHGTMFYLINPDGKIIKYYSGIEKESLDQIMEDLEIVL